MVDKVECEGSSLFKNNSELLCDFWNYRAGYDVFCQEMKKAIGL